MERDEYFERPVDDARKIEMNFDVNKWVPYYLKVRRDSKIKSCPGVDKRDEGQFT